MGLDKKQTNTLPEKDFLWIQLRELPYFRGLLRAVEAKFYQDLDLQHPILDLGCGDGHFASRTFDFPIETGVDPWKGPLKEAAGTGAYLETIRCEGNAMPLPDQFYKTIISNSVLEHIPDVDAVIVEAGRVIQPDGLFVFCVPNHQFLENLSISSFFDKVHLKFLGNCYRSFFNRISRHYHCDPPEIWAERLKKGGFVIEKYWHYFSTGAFHTLEWGHYFGLPYLFFHVLTRKWVLIPQKWALWLPEKICRKYYNEPWEQPDGAYTFYIARKIKADKE